MYFGGLIENAVLWEEFFEGWTRDNWEKLKDEDGPRTWYGRAYEFDVNCLDYLDSDEYTKDKELYSKLIETIRPYMGSIINDYQPFEIFKWDPRRMVVELSFEYDFQDKYDATYDEYPEAFVKGTWDDIVENVKNHIELLTNKITEIQNGTV